MKAAVYTRHGSPDVVQIVDIEKPTPKDNEVLIKVRAASANPLDWKGMSGGPYLIRKLLDLQKPMLKPLGADVAGQVEAVGRNVTRFQTRRRDLRHLPWRLCRIRLYLPISAGHEISIGQETQQRDVRASSLCTGCSTHRIAGSS